MGLKLGQEKERMGGKRKDWKKKNKIGRVNARNGKEEEKLAGGMEGRMEGRMERRKRDGRRGEWREEWREG